MHETVKAPPVADRVYTLMRVYRAALKAGDAELRVAILAELEKFGIQQGDLIGELTPSFASVESEARR